MFSRLYIDLILLYKKLYTYSLNMNRNYFKLNRYNIEFYSNKINDNIKIRELYDDFIEYYDIWYLTYFS